MTNNDNAVMVSVICATYNHAKYIRSALEGFVNQKTNFKYEVIVHDDASTDETAAIVREYEEKYPDIIVPIYQAKNVHSQHISVLTYILPKMRGKYVASCEGDDYWTDPQKLQKQVDYMESHPECSLVSCESKVLYEDTGRMADHTEYDFAKHDYDVPIEDLLKNHMIITTASIMYRSSYFERNAEILKEVPKFDYVTKTLLATEGTVHVLPGFMSVYRKGSDGSWTKRVENNTEAHANHLKRSFEALEKIDEYRDFKYHDILGDVILDRKFRYKILVNDLPALKEEPFRALYKALPAKRKLTMHLKRYAHPVYSACSSVKRAIKKSDPISEKAKQQQSN